MQHFLTTTPMMMRPTTELATMIPISRGLSLLITRVFAAAAVERPKETVCDLKSKVGTKFCRNGRPRPITSFWYKSQVTARWHILTPNVGLS